MANGDDKKKTLPAGQHSGYTGYVDNLGGSQYYQGEVDKGGGNYYIEGEKAATRKVEKMATDNETYLAGYNNPTDRAKAQAQGYDISNRKELLEYVDWKGKNLGYRSQKDRQNYTQSFKDKSSKVTNTTDVSKNQNKGNGGGTNIATATATGGAGGSVGNINIGGGGKTTTPQVGTSTTPKPGTSTKPAAGTSTTTTPGTTSQYSGNNGAANQATATATGGAGGSVGNITINTGGGGGSTPGGGGGTPGPLADGGGSAIDKLLGRIPKPKATFKKTTGRRNQTTQGGNTPYKFRGLQNQFESWQMNHYDNNDKTT